MNNMFRFSSAFIIVTIISGNHLLYSQDLSPKLGFRIAPNVGWMKPDARQYDYNGIAFGFSWGFLSEFPLTVNYGISTGFNIVFNNGKLKYPHIIGDTGTLNQKYNLKYFELPFMIKMKTADKGGPVFYAQTGLGLGMRIDAKGEGSFVQNNGNSFDIERDIISDEICLLKASLLIGLGFEYPVGASSKIITGFQFSNGFTNVLKGNNLVNSNTEHAGIPNFIELNLGFLF
jgi:hypothetical protein